jgi:HD-like signal output (HDOD) protein/signal transduction histidine kinase
MSQAVLQLPDELRARKVELVLQQLDSLPSLPAVALRLLTLTGSSESNIREVVEAISLDPALTSKILSLVQSAAAATRVPVTSVHQAVVMLGFEAVRNLVLSVKVFEIFQTNSAPLAAGKFDRAAFWKHSLAVATAAELLAPHCNPKLSPHDAFVCGLLHDLGKVAFDTAMPKSFDRAVEVSTLTRSDIADAERRVIGIDHSVAGKRLAEAWNLPGIITQSIWLHGSSPQGMPGGLVSPGMVQLIGLADMIARRQHIGFSGNFLFPFESSQYIQALGISEQILATTTDTLTEQLEKKAKAIGLYDVQTRQLYLESIANANAELARVNQAMTVQNRKLSARSTCFELLTKFYQRIVPAASPAQLLAEIAHVAHDFLGAQRLVLFSQDPDHPVGEVLTFDDANSTHDSFLMQMPKAGGDQRVGRPIALQDFIRPAVPQLEWLLERVQSFLGPQRCWFMPLLSGSDPVGGILWTTEADSTPVSAVADLPMVSQSWGMTLRMAQVREQQNVLTEALSASNRELASVQQQLVRARSIAGLGEMAAGAAHEMNNPLAVICGRAQLLASKISDATLKQDAILIAQQGERLSQMITDLMEFARPAPPKMAPASIDQIVRQAVEDANSHAGPTAETKVIVEADPSVPNINVDARQIRSAIGEVILNAIQASKPAPDAKDAHPADVLVQIRYDAMDNQAIIQVSDRGRGMDEDTLRQAFAPFFSAKNAGRQRGMGLPKALRYIEAHGGTIRLDSLPNAGTTAVIIIPQHPTT